MNDNNNVDFFKLSFSFSKRKIIINAPNSVLILYETSLIPSLSTLCLMLQTKDSFRKVDLMFSVSLFLSKYYCAIMLSKCSGLQSVKCSASPHFELQIKPVKNPWACHRWALWTHGLSMSRTKVLSQTCWKWQGLPWDPKNAKWNS